MNFSDMQTWLCSKQHQLTLRTAHAYSFSAATLTRSEQSQQQRKCIKASTWKRSHSSVIKNDVITWRTYAKTLSLPLLNSSISIFLSAESHVGSHTKWSVNVQLRTPKSPHVLLSRKMFQSASRPAWTVQ